MDITDVRITIPWSGPPNLLGFCSIVLGGCIAVNDLRVIRTPRGMHVAMPNRQSGNHCQRCRASNAFNARFCNQCAARFPDDVPEWESSPERRHRDVLFPINQATRDMISRPILDEYGRELERIRTPK